MSTGTSNTSGLQIGVRRVFSASGQVVDMPEIDALAAVNQHPSEWSFSPFPGHPTDLIRTSCGAPLKTI